MIRLAAGDRYAALLEVSGPVDERFDGHQLSVLAAPVVVLEVSKITRITSFGVRRWSEAMKELPQVVKHVYLLGCSPSFVDQLNMVLNFGGRSEVITANGIWFCTKCDDERVAPIDVYADRARIASGRVTLPPCPVCGGALQLEDAGYLRFATTYGAKSIDSRARNILAEAGLYHVREEGRPPEEMKLIHGDVTLLCLSGTLDQRFQPRRLASGIEGDVVFDLGQVEGADATGCERWRRLLSQLKNVEQLVLADLPEPLLPFVADGKFTVDGAVVDSLRLSYSCNRCQEPSMLTVETSGSPSAPRACPRCGGELSLAADAQLVDKVLERARASLVPISPGVEEVIAQRSQLIARAQSESSDSGAARGLSPTRYKLLKQLSQGGMGEILLAMHQSIGGFEKLVALKKIRREMLDERKVASDLFLAEAKLAANLNHPNIVQIFEIGQQGGDLFIAMEYIHGADVRTLLREAIVQGGKHIPLEVVLYIGKQVASALHHAHVASDLSGKPLGIVHRDVSPSNIVMGFDGQVKLVDFGIAVTRGGEQQAQGLVGKVSYMSPEQISGQPLDGRSDVFSLGVVLYELILLRPLFRRESDEQTTRAVWVDALPPLQPEGVPPFVEQALAGALVRMRDKRYADAHELERVLDECLSRLRTPVSNQSVAKVLRELFPTQSATPPIDRGSSSGSKPQSADYLDVVPVDSQTSRSAPGAYADSAPPVAAAPAITPTEVAPVPPPSRPSPPSASRSAAPAQSPSPSVAPVAAAAPARAVSSARPAASSVSSARTASPAPRGSTLARTLAIALALVLVIAIVLMLLYN